MKKHLHGRIVRIASGADYSIVKVAVNGRLLPFRLPTQVVVKVRVGDIISFGVDQSGNMEVKKTYFSPEDGFGSSRDIDAYRWSDDRNKQTRAENLFQRQKIIQAIRQYFIEQDFLEAQVPLLIRGTCPDPYVDSIAVGNGYLTTSTEYQIKRLIAGGFERVYTLCSNFRENEISDRHNPEFTMLEWGRAYSSMTEIENDAKELIRRALNAIHPDNGIIKIKGREVSIANADWEQISIRDALGKYCNMDVPDDFPTEALLTEAKKTGIEIPKDFCNDRSMLLSFIIDHLQKRLGFSVPTFLTDWPAYMTSSAPNRSANTTVTERTELIIGGMEISDGFPWLTDADTQRKQFDQALNYRKSVGKSDVQIDNKYLAAISNGMPPGAGMALGVDRLIMILTGAAEIKDVMTFAWDEL